MALAEAAATAALEYLAWSAADAERQISSKRGSKADSRLPAICAHHHLGFELQNPAAFPLEPGKAGCRGRPGMTDREMAHLPR